MGFEPTISGVTGQRFRSLSYEAILMIFYTDFSVMLRVGVDPTSLAFQASAITGSADGAL